jgi:hypothetical protein
VAINEGFPLYFERALKGPIPRLQEVWICGVLRRAFLGEEKMNRFLPFSRLISEWLWIQYALSFVRQ